MGALLEKPKTEKSVSTGSGNGIEYGLCSMQGWRTEMEDAHSAHIQLPPPFKSWSYFGVFDGHAGSNVAHLCSDQLLEKILETEEFTKLGEAGASTPPDLDLLKSGIVKGFLKFDADLSREERSGSTAVTAFVTPTHIVLANCGDSRTLLIRSDELVAASEDHKPNKPLEMERIQKAGGQVMMQRVNGSLAVSRSLGDFEYKRVENKPPTEQLVSPEPDVICIERNKVHDQLIVLACDGIWDVFENVELIPYVLQRLRCGVNLEALCTEIVDTCFYKGSRDNMSVLLVGLNNKPKPDPEAVRKDTELDTAINTAVADIYEAESRRPDIITVEDVAKKVQSMNLPNYPPGGFVTKRAYLEDRCKAQCQSLSNYAKKMTKGKIDMSPSTQ